jgi:hypothetical protein
VHTHITVTRISPIGQWSLLSINGKKCSMSNVKSFSYLQMEIIFHFKFYSNRRNSFSMAGRRVAAFLQLIFSPPIISPENAAIN